MTVICKRSNSLSSGLDGKRSAELDSGTPGQKADTSLHWKQLEAMRKSDVPVIWVVRAMGSLPDHECILGDGMAKNLFSCGCTRAQSMLGFEHEVHEMLRQRDLPLAEKERLIGELLARYGFSSA